MKNFDLEDIADFLFSILPWLIGAGAVIGLIATEYLYFTNAENVRLLFVILLAPVGAILGGLAVAAAIYALVIVSYLGLIALGFAAVAGVIYLLYSIVVWSN